MIDERPFLCYDNESIITIDRKGHFPWEIPQKIKK